MSDFLEVIIDALGGDQYHPSTVALASDPIMKIMFVSGWLAMWFACALIAVGLAIGSHRGKSITMSPRAGMIFSVLFFLMGADFLLSMATVFIPIYRLKVVVLSISAFVTVTAGVLSVGQIFGIDLRVYEKD